MDCSSASRDRWLSNAQEDAFALFGRDRGQRFHKGRQVDLPSLHMVDIPIVGPANAQPLTRFQFLQQDGGFGSWLSTCRRNDRLDGLKQRIFLRVEIEKRRRTSIG